MIKEIEVNELITYEYPPDGGKVPIIDPYDGCSLQCPYCFQFYDEQWSKDILIKTNIHRLIETELPNWDKTETIYIGSRCDPYMPMEEKYGITQKCLKELDKLRIPCMIVTKSATKALYRDIDILQNYSSDLTMVFGISNLEQLKNTPHCWEIKNIETINHLHDLGIKVWAFITPILPGITDVEKIIEHIHEDIPVFLDKARLEKDKKPAQNMVSYIKKNYPQLTTDYERIVDQEKDSYCEYLKGIYAKNPRVRFVFD